MVRVLCALANCNIHQKDFDLAVLTLEDVLKEEQDPIRHAKVISVLGRVYLQLGDVESAEAQFSKARAERAKLAASQAIDLDNLLDDALLFMANGDFANALVKLQEADKLDTSSASVVNDIAVCLLYLGI